MKIKNTKTITVQDWNDCVVETYGGRMHYNAITGIATEYDKNDVKIKSWEI